MSHTSSPPLRIAELEVDTAGGMIGITFAPGKKQPNAYSGAHDRDVGVDLDVIAAWNAAAVVTLVEEFELEVLQIQHLGHEVERRFMEWHHWPIVDVSIPDETFETAWDINSAKLRGLLERDGRVLIHCKGGLGRAGTIAARLLVEIGAADAETAISMVRAVRPGAVEMESQERWVARGSAVALPTKDEDESRAYDRAIGALVGLAIGDALGTTLEFEPKPHKAVLKDMVGGGPFNLKPGEWTDDTAMALALADSLLADPKLDPADLMKRFSDWYADGRYSCTGTCFDIGITIRGALERYLQTGDPFAGSSDPRASGNGALMRLAPVSIRHCHNDRSVLRHVAKLQTRTTHGSPQTISASVLSAELMADLIAGEPLSAVLAGSLANEIATEIADWRGLHRDAVRGSGYVVHSL